MSFFSLPKRYDQDHRFPIFPPVRRRKKCRSRESGTEFLLTTEPGREKKRLTVFAFPIIVLRWMQYGYYGILDSIAPQGTLLPSLIAADSTNPTSAFRTTEEAKPGDVPCWRNLEMMSCEQGAESRRCRFIWGADVKTHESNYPRPNFWSPSGETGHCRCCLPGRKFSPPSDGGGARAERNKKGRERERGRKHHRRALRKKIGWSGRDVLGRTPLSPPSDFASPTQGREKNNRRDPIKLIDLYIQQRNPYVSVVDERREEGEITRPTLSNIHTNANAGDSVLSPL